jgi:hypothetical protein
LNLPDVSESESSWSLSCNVLEYSDFVLLSAICAACGPPTLNVGVSGNTICPQPLLGRVQEVHGAAEPDNIFSAFDEEEER